MRNPVFYSKDLTEHRLNIISEKLLEAIDDAEKNNSSPNSTPWTIGTINYGFQLGKLFTMADDPNYPWLKLLSKKTDCTFVIGSTPVQVVTDDPSNKKKHHRLKKSIVEKHQYSLELGEDNNNKVVTWRLYSNIAPTGLDYPPSISLLGFDENNNEISRWEHDSVIRSPIISSKPEPIELKDAKVSLKSKSKTQKFKE